MDLWKFRVNGKKIGYAAVFVLAVLLLLLLGRVLIGIVQGTFNFVLGVIVLLLLAAIVVWMFAYADRARRLRRHRHRHKSSRSRGSKSE